MAYHKPEPVLKWAGGKRQLLDTIEKHLPDMVKEGNFTYIEPFIGGGAVFFYLLSNYSISKSVIIDSNQDLILLYKTIKSNVGGLIEILKKIQEGYYPLEEPDRKEYFYEKRKSFNAELKTIDYEQESDDWLTHSANLIFLNRTCFNGLYRVNQKGEFNVPFGRYNNPKICNEKNLISVSKALSNTKILSRDFEKALDYIEGNTFLYFDPPYRPLSTSSSFTAYAKSGFNDDEQVRLAKFYWKLNGYLNVKLMLSNSDPKNADENDDFFDNLYEGFNILRVAASRRINSKQSGRGLISELLVLNYETKDQ